MMIFGRSQMLCACALVFLGADAAMAAQGLVLRTLSSRPDMISGGDVLVQITLPAKVSLPEFGATLNGRDVTRLFRPNRTPGVLIGRVEGLALGKNTLEVRTGASHRGQLELINHPITGPIFSGPHQKPFICQTEAAGLGPALDTDCSAKTMVAYVYKSNQPPPSGMNAVAAALQSPFKPFEPSGPRPADLAQTTTTEGHTQDYIVRRETGTINRAIYEIAFLHQPGQPLPGPSTSVPGWNGRLVYSFGGGCAAGYRQGRWSEMLDDEILSRGYAMATASLNVSRNNCDDVISAETMMMVKEHFIKQFGLPEYTIGSGNSGGAIQLHLIAQNYPGLLDGILPTSSFPDAVTLIPPAADCFLLAHAFEIAKQPWTDDQKTAVSGYATWKTCTGGFIPAFPQFSRPAACDASIPKELIYSSAKNPKGVRCDLYDNQVNIFGRDPSTGFARRPLDNTGVQYGFATFNAAKISAEQFLELNERIGGYDIDGNIVSARMVADPMALRTAYQTGRVNTGSGGLSSVPIIDWRRYGDPYATIHDEIRTYSARARLMAANGRADNHVVLTLPRGVDIRGANFRVDDTMALMDKWLDNIAKDTSHDSAAVRVARNKPPGLVDACWTPQGEKIAEPQSYDGPGRCSQLYPAHGDPRIAAGAPLANDILKCALKPLNPKDYTQPLTTDQLARLKAIFPNGVCDFSRPGVEQQNTKATWLKY